MQLRVALFTLLALTACRTKDAAVVDADGDGYLSDVDCDDSDVSVHPDAEESCNGVDDDCDAAVDEDAADAPLWYTDGDGDGYGAPETGSPACVAPEGAVAAGTDCDDADPAFHPGAAEPDCADPADYNCDGSVGYADEDGDGVPACQECDDQRAEVYPGADERCDALDNDCDGVVDEDPVDGSLFYLDRDQDGYGDPGASVVACEAPGGAVADDTDCDDLDASAFPGGEERCDGADNDCDGQVDEEATDATTWYLDSDRDRYGGGVESVGCEGPDGYVDAGGDCDDTRSTVHPGAVETCDGADDDCDGQVDEEAVDALPWYQDLDADGYGDPSVSARACAAPEGYVADDTDCAPADQAVSPGVDEVCDAVDNNCDGVVDTDAVDAPTWYRDLDRDGFAGQVGSAVSCEAPEGWLAEATDCDDADRAVHPAALEVCDGIDNNCDGATDAEDAWWDASWPHRIPVTITGGSRALASAPAVVALDLRAQLDAAGVEGPVDLGSLRLVRQSCEAGLPVIPSQWIDEVGPLMAKADHADPAGDEAGALAFEYGEDGDLDTLEVLAAGAREPFAVYLRVGDPSAPLPYDTDLVVDEAVLSNDRAEVLLDPSAGGLLDYLGVEGSENLSSQTLSCCGNGVYSGSWDVDFQDGVGEMSVLARGPVVGVVQGTGVREGLGTMAFTWTWWRFAHRPELWAKVQAVAMTDLLIDHTDEWAQGVRPWESQQPFLSVEGAVISPLVPEVEGFYGVNSAEDGFSLSVAWYAPPDYPIDVRVWVPYTVMVGNDHGPLGAGTPYLMPAGTVFFDNLIEVVYPHAAPWEQAREELLSVLEGASVEAGALESVD
ncbi:MAG: putative metal-binding motif-containing protein [Deltaproteobacteria bacterium]|nr:putative metal-binding motif-containing protein [Deltaproteobacteria bacterium]